MRSKDQLQLWHDEDERTELASLLALISGGPHVNSDVLLLCLLSSLARFHRLAGSLGFVQGSFSCALPIPVTDQWLCDWWCCALVQ